MKFTEDMIGKWVRERANYGTFDEGVIISAFDYHNQKALVRWHTGQFKGNCLEVLLDDVEFINESNTHHPESIVIDGVKYRLVRED